MDKKYYVDKDGLIKLVQSMSDAIIQHTSGEITFTERINPQTGEVEKILDNPNNFTTVKAVTDYLKNRKKLKFVQQSLNDNDVVTEYNGDEEVQIDIKLATAEDITKLFN